MEELPGLINDTADDKSVIDLGLYVSIIFLVLGAVN
jgi:hypothetical protein